MIGHARAMRQSLRARQDECEAIGCIPSATQQELVAAGIYRTVQPRRFGGYEFSVETFLEVMIEIARGCPSTGWAVALTSGHPLVLSRFGEQAQIEAYGVEGEF